MIILEKAQEKEKQLVVRNINKIALVKITKTLSPINLDSKYILAISNIDINATRDFKLIGIKKH